VLSPSVQEQCDSLNQPFSNFFMLRHTNTFWIWLRHTYFMKAKTYFSQTLRNPAFRKICSIRFCQNIKLSRHTAAFSAAHSLGNTGLNVGLCHKPSIQIHISRNHALCQFLRLCARLLVVYDMQSGVCILCFGRPLCWYSVLLIG